MKLLENKFKLAFKNYSFNFSNVSKGVKPFLLADLINKSTHDCALIVLSNNAILNSYLKIYEKTDLYIFFGIIYKYSCCKIFLYQNYYLKLIFL